MNKKRMSSRVNFMVCILLLMLCLTGCGSEGNKDEDYDVVFTFNGKDITLGETYIYARTIQQDYIATYGKDVWSLDVTLDNGAVVNMEEITREDIINNIVRVKILCEKADDFNIALSEEEKNLAVSEADDFWKNLTDEQILEMQLSEEIVQQTLIENALAEKVYSEIVSQAEIEVSDEEARETTFYDMYFECYSENADGSIKEYSEEEKKTQYEKALQAYSTLIDPIDTEDTGNIESLSEYYGLTNSAYYTMSPEEIEMTYGTDICEDLYKLEDGSYSLVTETEYGYHIFYMVALTDREATDANKAELTAEKEKRYFDGKYTGWLKDIDKKFSYEDSVDMKIYEKISF